MSEMLDEVRKAVATDRGLPDGAEAFVSGTSLAELEASADALSRLVASHSRPERSEPQDLFVRTRAEKAERQRTILAMFTGRGPQARNDLGQFSSRGSFDGGARQPVAAPRDAEQEHGKLIGHLAAESKLGRSDPF
jgi:hypothetical protein